VKRIIKKISLLKKIYNDLNWNLQASELKLSNQVIKQIIQASELKLSNQVIKQIICSRKKMENSLQGVLSSFYKTLGYIEKVLLYLFLADTIGYALLFIGFLISTGNFIYDILFIPLIFFPMTSGIIMVNIFYLYSVNYNK